MGRNGPCQNLFTFDYFTIILQLNRLATSLFLLGFVLDAAALTLGQPQGAALIGRPLNLSIPVSFGEGETGDGFCAEAEVLQGASRVDPGRVSVTVESDPRTGGSRLRVRSSVVIDEPVINVTVRAGCAMKSTRQYVLLADMPPEVALPAVGSAASSSSANSGRSAASSNNADGNGRQRNGAVSPAASASFPEVPSGDADRARRRANAEAVLANANASANANANANAGANGDRAAATRDVPREEPLRRSVPPRASVAASAAPTIPTAAPRAATRTAPATAPAAAGTSTASRPRLQLDSAVPAATGTAALAASAGAARPSTAAPAPAPALTPAPSPSPAASAALPTVPPVLAPALAASAAAPLAAASSAAVAEAAASAASAAIAPVPPTPEEAERAARLQVMESTLAALRAQSAETQRTLTDMRSQLAESRESRYLNPIVYVLIGLLLLALIAIAWLLRTSRRRAASAWWNDSMIREEDPRGPAGGDGAGTAGRSRPAPLVPGSALLAAQGVRNDADVNADDEEEPADKRQAALVAASADVQEDESDLAPARNVNTEELFDVQQQSDFFLSLGQHAQAIAVLSEHIAENPQTSALAYLDLLRIHHSLGNRDAYGRVGHEFERVFNATLPSFDNFNDGGNGLEHYRSTLSRITEHWPASETLVLIEELVFRRPGTDGNEAFDLAAYQELLLLYAVAKEVIDPDSAPPAPVTPLSYLDTAAHGPTTAPSPLAALAPLAPTAAVATAATAATVAPLDFSLELDPEPTRPAAFMPYEPATPASEISTGPAPLFASPSIFGSLEERVDSDRGEDTHPGDLEGPTARVPLFPDAPLLPTDTALDTSMNTSMDTISELTRDTTLDSNLIDFELFDPETEAKIAPKPTRY